MRTHEASSKTLITAAAVVLVAAGCGGEPDAAEPADGIASDRSALVVGVQRAQADFNGDGYADVAIGAPGEDIGSIADAGAVHVIYGSAEGLKVSAGPGDQLWDQNTPYVAGGAAAGDAFGAAVAPADFNGDGYSDLAIGVPGDDINGVSNAGSVVILYGSAAGLSATRPITSHLIRQGGLGIAGTPESNDAFGSSLATGDFNGDGYDDLAVGAPNEDIGSIGNAGAVNMIFGSANGLSAYAGPGNGILHQDEDAESNDLFGTALAAGDFDCDGRDDLAVGVPGEDFRMDRFGTLVSYSDAGQVSVFYSVGVNALRDINPQNGARLGSSLAAGELGRAIFSDGPSCDDLLAGAPRHYLGSGVGQAGRVVGFFGDPRGLRYSDDLSISRRDGRYSAAYGRPTQTPTSNVEFGAALAIGDFDADGNADVAVGVPADDVTLNGVTYDAAGSVELFSCYACPGFGKAYAMLNRASSSISGAPGNGDRFGATLSAGAFGRARATDLLIGAPSDDLRLGGVDHRDAGSATVVYDSLGHLRSQALRQGSSDGFGNLFSGTVEPGDRYASSAD